MALPLAVPASWNDWTRSSGSLSVTLLQGNIPQNEKFEVGTGVARELFLLGEKLSAAEAFAKGGKPLPMFMNHNSDAAPIGEWTSFEMTDECMTAEGRIYTNTSAGKDIYTIMQESPTMFGGVSVGAYADEYSMVDAEGNPVDDDTDEGFFQITKGGLREISVVMYPNNPSAEVMNLEYFDDQGHANPRIIEKALRDAGLSRKDATTASSILKKVLEQRDAEPVTVEVAPQQGELEAVVKEADEILKALEQRELLKALSNRIK